MLGSNEIMVINLFPSRKVFQTCYKWLGIWKCERADKVCSQGYCRTKSPNFPRLEYGKAVKMTTDQAIYFNVADGYRDNENELVRPMCDNSNRYLVKGGIYV